MLSRWSELISENSNDLATIMCLESGKPKAESKGEIHYAMSFINMYAGMQTNGMVLPQQTNNHLLMVTKEVGNVCIARATTWNETFSKQQQLLCCRKVDGYVMDCCCY